MLYKFWKILFKTKYCFADMFAAMVFMSLYGGEKITFFGLLGLYFCACIVISTVQLVLENHYRSGVFRE